ncbi:MAG: peptide ABC transporter substrate-binding protein [Chloroflexi bacterium]|nr:peptide ABC transporter substrate-binding protein [Chloroflexota bacterium]
MKKYVVLVVLALVVAAFVAACAAPTAAPVPTVPPAASSSSSVAPAPTSAPASSSSSAAPASSSSSVASSVAPTKAPEPTKAAAPAGPKVLRLGRSTYPDVLDPQKSSYGIEIEFLKLTYEGLLAIDEKGNIGPGGADKFEASKDGTKMTFHIRDGLKRVDGTAITAKDYEYALKREVDPCVAGKQYTSILYDIKGAEDLDSLDCKKDAAKLDAAWAAYGVKALDNSNLEVTFKNPIGFWQYIAYTWVTYPADKKKVDADPENWWAKATGHNGNGPFIAKTMEQGKRIVYEANPNYWRGKPKLDRIEVTYSNDALVMFEAYKKSEVDMDAYIVAENLASINADATLKAEFLRFPAAITRGMAYNNTLKPFDNVNARKAFSAAFDRETYVRDVLKGLGKPYTRWVPPGVPGSQDTKAGVNSYDAKVAVDLLVKNGFAAADSTADKPKVDCAKLGTLKMTYAATATNHARYQFIAGSFLKVFGCPITLDPVDSTVMTALTKDIKTQPLFSLQGWIQDYPHPQNWLSVYWVCGGFAKRYGYCSKDFDATTAKADQTLDLQAAIKLYQQAEDILVNDVPSAFLMYEENLYLVKPWVIGPKDHTGSSDAEWAGEWGPVWTYDIDLTKVPANYPKQ